MVTQLEVHQAEKAYIDKKREYEEQGAPLDPRNVREAINTIGVESKETRDRIRKLEEIVYELNPAIAEKFGVNPPIPF